MIAMQYGFDLADDFPMDRIRSRARERGPLFAAQLGLIEKAFLCRERSSGPASSLPNRYATFYLWRDAAAAQAFLSGELFAAAIETFGRPAIRLLSVLHHGIADADVVARHATEEATTVDGNASIAALAAQEARAHEAAPQPRGLRSCVVGLDPLLRELVRFSLWDAADFVPSGSSGLAYEVPYLAAPAIRGEVRARIAAAAAGR